MTLGYDVQREWLFVFEGSNAVRFRNALSGYAHVPGGEKQLREHRERENILSVRSSGGWVQHSFWLHALAE